MSIDKRYTTNIDLALSNESVSISSTSVTQSQVTTVSFLTGPQGDISSIYKQLAADPDGIIAGTITRNSDGAVLTASVIWPDGETGTFTSTVLSTSFPGAVDAYTITYDGTPARTYTQATVTRNSLGAVTNRPAIGVS